MQNPLKAHTAGIKKHRPPKRNALKKVNRERLIHKDFNRRIPKNVTFVTILGYIYQFGGYILKIITGRIKKTAPLELRAAFYKKHNTAKK
jgi:hypothetical protein